MMECNEEYFLKKWVSILKNEKNQSYLFFQPKKDNDCPHAIAIALKGIRYYYYGRIDSALYNINYALSVIDENCLIMKTLLNYYKICIIYDSNSIKLENCIYAYKSFVDLQIRSVDKDLCDLINILFHNKIPYPLFECKDQLKESKEDAEIPYKDKLNIVLRINLNHLDIYLNSNNEYKSLASFIKLRVLDAIAVINNDVDSWNSYHEFIKETEYIVDLPRATYYLLKAKNKTKYEINRILTDQIKVTKNAQVEKTRVEYVASNTSRLGLINKVLSLENQMSNNCLLFNSVDYCFDVIWDIDELELCFHFLEFIKNLDKRFLYLFNGNLIPDYVDHGVGHVLSIFSSLKEMHFALNLNGEDFINFFKIGKKDYLNLVEAILFHDIGMNGSQEIEYASGGKKLRENHALLSWKLLTDSQSDSYGLNINDRNTVAFIASLHNGMFKDKVCSYDGKEEEFRMSDLYKSWNISFKEFLGLLGAPEIEIFNQLVSILQLLDGIDFKKERVGINDRDSIVEQREILFKTLNQNSNANDVNEYFNNQIECLKGWEKHYSTHNYIKETRFHYETNDKRLNVTIILSNDHGNEDFKNNLNDNFFSNLNEYFEHSVNIEIL